MERLRLVVPVSIGLIAALLYTALRSWPLALLVLVNLPFAAAGGVLALWLRGLHLSVSASIGFREYIQGGLRPLPASPATNSRLAALGRRCLFLRAWFATVSSCVWSLPPCSF